MYKLYSPVFEVWFALFCGETEANRFAKLVERSSNGTHEMGDWRERDGCTWGTAIWVKDKNDLNTLVHEISHLLDNFMAHIGSADGETRAYMNGWLVEQFCAKIADKRRK